MIFFFIAQLLLLVIIIVLNIIIVKDQNDELKRLRPYYEDVKKRIESAYNGQDN